jgi:hypothetical protein
MNPEKTLGPTTISGAEPPDPSKLAGRIRVRLSPLGAIRCPNLAGREGVIIGTGHYRSTFRIMFDGFKSPTSLHGTYIEPMTEEGQPAACTGGIGSGSDR